MESSIFDIVFGELLPQILAKSTTSSLLEHRLVSQEWRKVATRLLLQRGDLKIEFHQAPDPSSNPPHIFTSFYALPPRNRYKSQRCLGHLLLGTKRDCLPRGDKTLPEFFRLVTYASRSSSPSSLPVNSFVFHPRGYEQDPAQLLSFVQTYGPKIRALTLENYVGYFMGRTGRPNFILQYTPNLETLVIRETLLSNLNVIPRQFSNPDRNTGAIILPHLKFIEIHQELGKQDDRREEFSKPTFKILEYLLQIAPKLERVSFPKNFDLDLLEVFLHPGDINLLNIQTIFLTERDLFFPEGLELIEKLAEVTTMTLRHLKISVQAWPSSRDCWIRGSSALHKILGSNANSLKEVDLIGGAALLLYHVPNLPALGKVSKLTVISKVGAVFRGLNPAGDFNFDNLGNEGVSRIGIPLSRLFPNLGTLDLSGLLVRTKEEIEKWFPYCNDRLMQVKTLKSQTCLFQTNNFDAFETCARALNLCPKIRNFETRWPFYKFPLLAQPLWSLTQLTSLTIEFVNSFGGTVGDLESFVELDATLTGMPKEIVRTMYNNWQRGGLWQVPPTPTNCGVEGTENWQFWRVNSSLINLPNLQRLQLEIRADEYKKPLMLISGVTAKFAFDLMKNLRIFLAFNFSTSFVICYECLRQGKREEWFDLHRPLSTFSNVTLGLKEEMPNYEDNNYDNCYV